MQYSPAWVEKWANEEFERLQARDRQVDALSYGDAYIAERERNIKLISFFEELNKRMAAASRDQAKEAERSDKVRIRNAAMAAKLTAAEEARVLAEARLRRAEETASRLRTEIEDQRQKSNSRIRELERKFWNLQVQFAAARNQIMIFAQWVLCASAVKLSVSARINVAAKAISNGWKASLGGLEGETLDMTIKTPEIATILKEAKILVSEAANGRTDDRIVKAVQVFPRREIDRCSDTKSLVPFVESPKALGVDDVDFDLVFLTKDAQRGERALKG